MVRGADVTIGNNSGTLFDLPSGKKTLIVIDGNVTIRANTRYVSEDDSFGLIVANSDPRPYPETGNIYVHSEVTNIRGSFFADGGMFTYLNINNTNPDFVDVIDAQNKPLLLNKQLRVVGAMLTKNTVG